MLLTLRPRHIGLRIRRSQQILWRNIRHARIFATAAFRGRFSTIIQAEPVARRTVLVAILGDAMKPVTVSLLLAGALTLSGCATPTVVDERRVGDDGLTCQQIEQEIQIAQRYEDQARDERGVTGTNVAAALFFWPGLIATAANTDEAIDAAQERQDHLRDIYRAKGC